METPLIDHLVQALFSGCSGLLQKGWPVVVIGVSG
jgi:hypothetical protein